MTNSAPLLTIGIVAGEVSGDALGADFMTKMTACYPNVRWVGVGGSLMSQAGLTSIFALDRLSVMGLVEVVKHLPELLVAKTELLHAFARHDIDIFVGIDAPDFNLRVSKALKRQSLLKNVFCVQYVSPSIWAWRENRIHTIKQATDLVLCLFPFELAVYQKHHHPAVCVGHPLLDKLHADTRPHNQIYQEFLSTLNPKPTHNNAYPVCVMAGSRRSEICAILPVLLTSLKQLNQYGEFVYFLPVVHTKHIRLVNQIVTNTAPDLRTRIHIINTEHSTPTSQMVMNACQIILLASGTATLEALLLNRPMVVVYKVNTATYHIAKRLLKIPYYSLPNILSYNQNGTTVVPELIQENATASQITSHAKQLIDTLPSQQQKLAHTALLLRQNSHANSAQAVLTHFFRSTAKS